MKDVVAYIRVSTDNQCKEDKYGLDVQRQQITEYCEKHDMNIVKWYSDEGESGAKERPGFDEIIYGEVTNPPVEYVVVAKSDRVARDIEIYYYYKMMLHKKNINLISISEDFGRDGIFSKILEHFTVMVAEMERDNISKRTSAGRGMKSSAGGYSGGRPPFGYKAKNHSLVISPEEADTVKIVFRMKDVEKKTYKEIVNYLNDLGRRNRSGTAFSISTVQTIYENKKTYQGYYKYGSGMDWVRGMHEPILKEV